MKIELQLASRYAELIKSLHPEAEANKDYDHPSSMDHLLWLCNKAMDEYSHPLARHRSLGIVQGSLATLGLINMNDEIKYIDYLVEKAKEENNLC
jgi:hypothetical protein